MGDVVHHNSSLADKRDVRAFSDYYASSWTTSIPRRRLERSVCLV